MEKITDLPLSLTVPAASAALAYLDAKYQISYDWQLLSTYISGSVRLAVRERRDRVNLFYSLEDLALNKKTGERIWIMYEGREWTYRQAYDNILRYGQWLRKEHGVQPREIVAVDAMNSPMFVWLWFGLWSIGARPAFINYNLTGRPLVHCVNVSTARLLLVDDEVRHNVTQAIIEEVSSPSFRDGKGSTEVIFLTPATLAPIETLKPVREPDAVRSGPKMSDMSILIYTSGTTGLPKPGIVSWTKASLGGFFISRWMKLKPTDRFYTCMPLYHTSAAVLGLCTTINAGCTLVIGHKFGTKTFWPDVKRHDSTVIQYVGEMCRYLLTATPSPFAAAEEKNHNVRIAFGNGLRPDVWGRFQERFGIDTIAEIYAATEGPSIMGNLSRNQFSRGAVGRNGLIAWLLMGTQVTLVKFDHEKEEPWRDPATGLCQIASEGEPGEMLNKLDAADIERKFQGYYGNKAATEKKIMRDVYSKGDAWFRTGDLLYFDSEGKWFFSDRIGDTFRWKSENVSTSEVAEVVGLHPAIQEANVYGVLLPNHDGRAGCAAVVLHEGQEMGSALRTELAEWVGKNLPRYAIPLFVRVTREGALTGTMKLQKNALRDQGVDPEKTIREGDLMFWLKPGSQQYVPFEKADWERVVEGNVRL
ncbi:MAG: hypothetical protein M1822_000701 [Bathelium mastoideum]|nr:MAG: hypothetical protein M1822_000701 [Bathelium mastoideum]